MRPSFVFGNSERANWRKEVVVESQRSECSQEHGISQTPNAETIKTALERVRATVVGIDCGYMR